MRGERATLGKSLLDVQRELKIKAVYIDAIENADPESFESQGFIAGYVRSYARYLDLDPEWAFESFCEESGFKSAHGIEVASSRKSDGNSIIAGPALDPFDDPNSVFAPTGDGFLSRIETGAIGSTFVLLALVGGIGYGAWSILQQVQKVQFAPVEQTPEVLSSVDTIGSSAGAGLTDTELTGIVQPSSDALDRLYRPQALDTPVLIPRDAPIASIDPASVGAFSQSQTAGDANIPLLDRLPEPTPIQVVDTAVPDVVLFAVEDSWVRVRAANGSVIFEKTLNRGEEYVVPTMETPPTLRAGNSGALYFKINGQPYGPAGRGSSTVRDVVLSPESLMNDYQPADPVKDQVLFSLINVAEANPTTE
nr:RodZ domain-containing protein [Pseudaestuariivita rosea]